MKPQEIKLEENETELEENETELEEMTREESEMFLKYKSGCFGKIRSLNALNILGEVLFNKFNLILSEENKKKENKKKENKKKGNKKES